MHTTNKCRFFFLISFILVMITINGCHKESITRSPNDEKIILEFHKDKFVVESGGGFVGSEKCRECHIKEYRSWKKTRHAKSFNTLLHIKKEKNINCLKCHTTGYGKKTGFENFEKTGDLASVGCESCHGPCQEHVNSEPAKKKETIYSIKGDCVKCGYIKYCIYRKSNASNNEYVFRRF